MIENLIQAMDYVVNICIGGTLDGQIYVADMDNFKSELDVNGKASKYYKQRFTKDKKLYTFWIDHEFNFNDATMRVKQILDDECGFVN